MCYNLPIWMLFLALFRLAVEATLLLYHDLINFQGVIQILNTDFSYFQDHWINILIVKSRMTLFAFSF